MKSTIATSPSQSQRLIACGVDPKTADMYWKEDLGRMQLDILGSKWIDGMFLLHCSPAWSLSRLLSLLPMMINDNGLQTTFQLDSNPDDSSWNAAYYDYAMDKYLRILCDKSPIESCVKAIEWMTKEGFKLNEIEE